MSGPSKNLKPEELKWLTYIAISLAIISIIAILIAGACLPRWFGDEVAPGIGDRIGGVTAPFIGLLNAVLVYMAFWQQKKANEEIREEMKRQKDDFDKEKFLESLRHKFEDLKEEISSISYESMQLAKVWRGSEFFFKIDSLRSAVGKGNIDSLHSISYDLDLGKIDASMYFILLSFESMIESIESSPISLDEKRSWMDRVSYLYRSKGVANIVKLTGECKIGNKPCSEDHGILAVCVYRKFLSVKSKLGGAFSEDA